MPESATPQRLSIVHVLGSFEIGGGEQVALNIGRGQVARGHRVHVVSFASGPEGPHAANFRAGGIETHTVAKLGPTFDPTLIWRLARVFRRLGAELVHTHNPLPLIYGGPAARLARLPVVHTKHGYNEAPSRRAWLRRLAASTADVLVAVSEQTAEAARQQREATGNRLAVITNGIDLSAYAPNGDFRARVRRELSIPEHARVLGTVGRLSEEKNQALLVRAAAPLLGQNVHLVIVGDGPDKECVEAAVRASAHLESIHLLGRRLDVPQLLPSFDVFVLPSKSEGLPMVLPEAMACGLPIVATAVGGVPSVVRDGETGFLVPSDDEKALRGRLSSLLEQPERMENFGKAARDLALSQYSQERMIDAYQAIYQQLMASRRPEATRVGFAK